MIEVLGFSMAIEFLSQFGIRRCLNVGGEGDCGFRSVAAGIIENFLVHQHFDTNLLNKILEAYFRNYTDHQPSKAMTSRAIMLKLLEDVPRPELVKTLAYSLRQLAVDELNCNPLSYPGAFMAFHRKMSFREMRQAGTWLDESAIVALAHRLHMPIEVRCTVPGKPLTAPPLLYAQDPFSLTIPKVVIQLEFGYYQSMLLDPFPFKSNLYSTPAEMVPVEYSGAFDKDLQEVMLMLEAEEKRMVVEFEILYRQLEGNLTTKELLSVFIRGMTVSDYWQGRLNCVNEKRCDQYFSMAIAAGRGVQISHPSSSSYDEEMKKELCHAIVRAISIGHMNVEDVFVEVDKRALIEVKQVSRDPFAAS